MALITYVQAETSRVALLEFTETDHHIGHWELRSVLVSGDTPTPSHVVESGSRTEMLASLMKVVADRVASGQPFQYEPDRGLEFETEAGREFWYVIAA